jgi:hypothetical protein
MSLSEAKDPKTLPPRLIELSQNKDVEILVAVTKNPNTPLPILLTLAQKYPAQFLQNPILPMLLLEHPQLLGAVDEITAIALLVIPALPDWVLGSLASHTKSIVRQAVAKHSKTPPSALGVLALDKDWDICRLIAKHPNTPPSSLEHLALHEDMHVRLMVAKHSKTPPSALELLARDEQEFVRENVARNPTAPPSLLEFIVKHRDEFRRRDKEREWRDADLNGPHW